MYSVCVILFYFCRTVFRTLLRLNFHSTHVVSSQNEQWQYYVLKLKSMIGRGEYYVELNPSWI